MSTKNAFLRSLCFLLFRITPVVSEALHERPNESAELRRILRRHERAFRRFIFAGVLVLFLVLLAMRGASASADPAGQTLRLNFHGARLEQVLEYLSEAAGFVIDKQTPVPGTVDIWSKGPVSRDEAVELLNAALKKSGCAVLRNGRRLTIVSESQAKISDLEVVTGSDPSQVEKSGETIAQLIPLRYASAGQLLNNLQVLLPASATLSANESANMLILVARKAEIRRMLKIISALDSSLAGASSLRVFPLRYADAKETATLLPQVFSQTGSGSSSRGQSLTSLSKGDFDPPGMPGMPPDSGDSGGTSASQKIVAVADERSNALVVSAPADFLPLITKVLQQLDQPAADNTELRVFRLANADATELASQLAELFSGSSSGAATQDELPIFAGSGPPPPGEMPDGAAAGGNTSGSGSRKLKQSRILAVADPRTSSLLVSAGSGLMPQVAALVAQLDSIAAGKQLVQVYELRNADPQDVNQILQDLFNRNGASRNNNNQNSMLGQNNPLTARQTQQQSSSTAGANLGTSGTGSQGATQGSASGF